MRERVVDGRKQASEKIHAIKKQVKQQQGNKKKLFDCAQKKCIAQKKRGEERKGKKKVGKEKKEICHN